MGHRARPDTDLVELEFAQCGLHTIRHNDTKAITAFAKQALTTDGFHLVH